MTRSHADPRLTACALGELDAEEQRQLEAALAGDTAACVELEEIRRVAMLVERELSAGTGLGLSARQRLQLQQAWQERNAGERNAAAGETGAFGEARAQPQDPFVRQMMFEDFASSPRNPRARKRFAKSVLAAIVVYGTASAVLVMASATVRKLVEEHLTPLEFAKAPEPEPAAPPPVKTSPAPKAKKSSSLAPLYKVSNDKVSNEKLKEPDKARVSAREGSPVDGFLDGVEGGNGICVAPPPARPPASMVEPLVPPGALGGADSYAIKYSSSARRKGVEGKVVVSFVVLEDGSVANVRTVSGPPELFSSVLNAVPSWRFRPAHRGSKPIRYSMTKTVTFRLEDP